MGIPQDQYAPGVASESQAARYRAWVIANIFAVHTVLIVTFFQISSIVAFDSIVTLLRQAIHLTWRFYL